MRMITMPFFEQHGVPAKTILSDDGREFCGRPDRHPYELCLQLEEIEHRVTRVRRPQSNGFVERFHSTLRNDLLRVKGRQKWCDSVEEMQKYLDEYLVNYNTTHPHQTVA